MTVEQVGARVGIDIGGTFTDSVRLDEQGRLRVAKVRTTPEEYPDGFIAALEAVIGANGSAGEVDYLVHGSTVATNALVTGSVARVGLLTTAGFRDVLEIGTQQRRELYDLGAPKAAPLVPRDLRLEVRERIGPTGEVELALEEGDVEAAARVFREQGVAAIAVCFLFSFVNDEHERRAGDLLGGLLPDVPISLSSQVAPEIREYVRSSTTTVNASLVPVISSYLEVLGTRLAGAGHGTSPHIMRSSGGVSTSRIAAEHPATLIASGPAAGVIGAAEIARAGGFPDILTFDVGGTTADVSLVEDGAPRRRYHGSVAGHPVNLPQVDVLSIGAGGGSIAGVDRFGVLRVGPESAGSDPGPVCYGKGGMRPTVTDAHLVIGSLLESRFAAGSMPLDKEGAEAAIAKYVGDPLGLDPVEAARAVIRMADATMARGLRLVSVERGHDPRELALFAFGGAGPMHAAAVADELGMSRVIVPRYPGVTSAIGLLLSDVRHDIGRTWVRAVDEIDAGELADLLAELERDGRLALASAGFEGEEVRIEFEADMRYRGQAYQLTVPVPAGEAEVFARSAEAGFHEAHRRAYGHSDAAKGVEIVALRVRANGLIDHSFVGGGAGLDGEPPERSEETSSRSADGAPTIVDRESLAAPVAGPALVLQDDTTIVVPPGWRARNAPGELCLIEKVDDAEG